VRLAAEQDLSAVGGRLQALSHVDGVAGGEGVAGRGVADDHFACIDSSPNTNFNAPVTDELLVELGERDAYLRSSADCP
jgi:hypothetical protein